jgi:hypothetical protein
MIACVLYRKVHELKAQMQASVVEERTVMDLGIENVREVSRIRTHIHIPERVYLTNFCKVKEMRSSDVRLGIEDIVRAICMLVAAVEVARRSSKCWTL